MAAASSVEALFICAGVKDGWPINIYDASTGTVLWSYKGSELQGELPGQSVIVADEYVFTTVVGRPVISHVSMQAKNRTHFRSFTPGPVQCLAITGDGSICSGATGEKIYTWLVGNGFLTSIVSGHYQAVTKLKFTSDGSFLISGGKDGRILAWNMVDLLQPETSSVKKPTSASKSWTAHSLPVMDMKVGFGGVNARVFSVSLDQSAKIHSLLSGQLLMTLIFDCALSACAVDDAETRFFVGTVKGDILQINLFMQPVARERHVQTSVENVDNPVFSGHRQKITELAVNLDSTLLASGSEDQTVRVWHINSRQCLRMIQCSGNVTTLMFISALPVIADRSYICTHPVQAFQKQLRPAEAQGQVVVKLKKSETDDDLRMPNEKELKRMLEELRNEEEIAQELEHNLEIEPEQSEEKEDVEIIEQEQSPSPEQKAKRRKRRRIPC